MILEGVYPSPGLVYIRKVATEETFGGGRIVVPIQAREKVSRTQFIVVSVGDYEKCPDMEECSRKHTKYGRHKHALMEGDWIICRNRSWMASPDPHTYIVRQSDVIAKLEE